MYLVGCSFRNIPCHLFNRAFSCTAVTNLKEWRMSRGLPINRNAEGVLTDGPDYTFLDGRPTPLLHKQKRRIERNREYATKIVEFISDLDFAKQRHKYMLKAAADERQEIINNRLKPKGKALLKKK